MKAVVQSDYDSSHDPELREIDKPTVADDEILVRVRAASANTYGWTVPKRLQHIRRIAGKLRKRNITVPGLDFAGRVEAVGRNAKQFQPGDEVFGWHKGTFCEYVSVTQDALALKPANLTLEQASVVPISGFTALQGLRDRGQLQAEQKVLIIGASGGVGTLAVQIAKAFDAEVTGVCSTPNLDMVRSIGADHVIDYTEEDFTQNGQHYDLLIDMAGNRSLPDLRRVLATDGTLVMVGQSGIAESDQGYLKAIGRWLGALVLSLFSRQRLRALLQTRNRDDLVALKELIEAGDITPVIGTHYTLREFPEAIRHFEEGYTRGRAVITM